MGRPINKKYFGNRNVGDPLSTSDDYGIGGKYVSAIATGTAGSGYSQGLTATLAAPTIAGGVTASATVGVYANGVISGYTVTDGGSGYTTSPAVTLVKPGNVTLAVTGSNLSNVLTMTSTAGIYAGMKVTGNTGLGGGSDISTVATVNAANVILVESNDGDITGNVTFYDAGTSGAAGTVTLAYRTTDITSTSSIGSNAFSISANVNGTSSIQGDILKQESSRRFRIRTTDGTAVCRLTNAAPQSGEVRLTAVDSVGDTYYIDKLTSRTALVTQGNGSQFATGAKVPWNITEAVVNTSIKINTV